MMKSNLFTRKSTNSWCLSLWFLRQRNCSLTLILWVFWSHAGQVKVQDLFDLEGYWCVLQEDKYNISSPYRHVTCDVYRWAGIYRDSYKSPPSDWGRQFSLSFKKSPFISLTRRNRLLTHRGNRQLKIMTLETNSMKKSGHFPYICVLDVYTRGNQRKGGHL